MQFDVPVHTQDGGVEVQAWAPLDYDVQTTQQATAAVQSPTRPTFERSESGTIVRVACEFNKKEHDSNII